MRAIGTSRDRRPDRLFLLLFILCNLPIRERCRASRLFFDRVPKLAEQNLQAFVRRLLWEADGDPVRALGLLVLALEKTEARSAERAQRLIAEVRHALMPELGIQSGRPVQHLAGNRSWEGGQQCLRCGKTLFRTATQESRKALSPGYVYEIGLHFSPEPPDDYDPCR